MSTEQEFADQLTAKLGGEAAPEEGTPAQEVPSQESVEETPAVRARDEQGRFAPAEQQTEAEQVVEGSDDEVAAYLAKYGGDADAAIRAAVEAQKLIGRQSNELGELRQAMEARFDKIEEKVDWDDEDFPVDSAPITQLADEGRFQEAATLALQAGDSFAYDKVMDAWADESPRAASRFETALLLSQQQQKYEQDFAALRQPIQEKQQADSFNQAFAAAAERHDDLMDLVQGGYFDKAIEKAPHVLAGLQNTSDPEAPQKTLDTLYTLAWAEAEMQRRGEQQAQTEQVVTQQADAVRAMKMAGTVLSASSTQARERSPVDSFKEQFRNALVNPTDIERGYSRAAQ